MTPAAHLAPFNNHGLMSQPSPAALINHPELAQHWSVLQGGYSVLQQPSPAAFQMPLIDYSPLHAGTSNQENLALPTPEADGDLRDSLLSLAQAFAPNHSYNPNLHHDFDMYFDIDAQIQPLETMIHPTPRNEDFISSLPQTSDTVYGMQQSGTSSTQDISADLLLTFEDSFNAQHDSLQDDDENDQW